MIILLITAALTVLTFLGLSRRRRERVQEAEQPVGSDSPGSGDRPAAPSAPSGAEEALRLRVLYLVVFWATVFLVAVWPVALPGAPAEVTLLLNLVGLGFLVYTTYRMSRLIGHSRGVAVVLCLLALMLLFAVLQYIAFCRRCRELYGPLRRPASAGPDA